MMVNVALIGVGLIGGSLGMALRRVRRGGKRVYRVSGWGRSRSRLQRAKRRGALDEGSTDSRTILSNADIVVFCLPVHLIAPTAKKFLPHFRKNAIVTDAGSVKEKLLSDLHKALRGRRDVAIVGAHPIAGSEKTGVENAEKDLFRRSTCVVVPAQNKRAQKKIENLWKAAGSRIERMNARDHDRLLAVTSHLPHLIALSLRGLARKKSALAVTGGAFRDMTRVAGADPALWNGIFRSNRKNIKRAAREFYSVLRNLI